MANPLITVKDLEHILENGDVSVVDCRWYLGEPERGIQEYTRGHVPGAVFASLDEDLSGDAGPGRHPLPTPEDFADTLATLGIGPSTTVVAYDDCGGAIASRLWWMLTDQGHGTASVLDGGIQAWIDAGHVLTRQERQPQIGAFRTRPWSDVVDRCSVVSRREDVVLMDARSPERYRGEEEPVDPKAGHIPGAISLPQTGNLTGELTFLPPGALRSRFADAGITEPDNVISYCGSGVTACHNILAMEVAGIGRPLLYVGSWSDWSSIDLPVTTGDAP
jgi:thiosulfate/3-mercaptopyruvate sulfurtransferase